MKVETLSFLAHACWFLGTGAWSMLWLEVCNYSVRPHPKSLSQGGRGTLKGFVSPSPFLGEGARG